MITANQLDLMYGTLLDKVRLPVFEIKDNDHESGLTSFSTTDDAFELKAPGAWLKPINCEFLMKEQENGFILRTVIPYAASIEMAKDYLYGVETLSLIKNHMLSKAAKRCSLSECQTVTLARPSTPSIFFRDSDNHAGFELRLYVQYKDTSLQKIG